MFICATGLFLGAASVLLGGQKTALPEFLLRSWDSGDGLPAARVQAIAQTDDGYLWAATSRGLARFDGVRFVVLTTNNTPELGDNRITSLLASQTGDLWVGTEGGFLSRCRGGMFERISLGEGQRGNQVNALAEDHEAAFWIGTRGAGLARWRQGHCDWFRVAGQTNTADCDVTKIITDQQGRLWAIANEKLAAYENGSWKVSTAASASGELQVVGLAPARDGGVWVATCASQNLSGRGTELFKLNQAGWTNQLAPYPWPQDTVYSRTARVMEDRIGRLWVATIGAGIFVWTEGTGWQPLTAPGQSSLAECSSLAEGKEGTLWAGTTDFLLFQIRSRPVTTLHLPVPANQNIVLAACGQRDGGVMAGTDGNGAYCYRRGSFSEVAFDPGPDNLQSHVGVFYEDRQTNFWAGTWAGLYRLEDGRFRRFTAVPALANVVLALREDSRGNLWAGTGAGVVRFGPDGTNLFARGAGIDHFYIRAIEEDVTGQIWVAITDRGLYQKSGARFEHYGAGQWAGESRIRGLHADPDGALWITTDNRGLARLKDGKFMTWTVDDGLPSDNLISVTEDASGNLWFSSANGIFGCPKSRLAAYQPGVSPPLLFWQLAPSEGLDTRRCSGAGQPAVAQSSDGRFWFPNWHALAVFDPTQVQRSLAIHPFPPLIEETLVDGVVQMPDASNALRVRSTVKSLEFHYTSPTLQAPDRLQFRYRLMGWDADWVDARSRRVAYYTHLPVGEYDFQVMAGGPDGVWQESRQKLQLAVVPRFWERRWVQVLAALGFLAGLVAAVWSVSRRRMRWRLAVLERHRALDAERSRIARDMHDEIGARLTQISLVSALVDSSAEDAAEVRTQNRKISGAARNLTRSLDEIVWAVRPQNDNLQSLVDYLDGSLRDLCEGSPLRYWFSGPPVVPAVEVPANVRHNVLLACSEVVNNALKYSRGSEVRVRLQIETRTLQIEIADNGQGFDVPKGEAKRSGLIHIRQRLEEIGGNCMCQSAPGQGTQFAFSVPIGPPILPAASGSQKTK